MSELSWNLGFLTSSVTSSKLFNTLSLSLFGGIKMVTCTSWGSFKGYKDNACNLPGPVPGNSKC